MSAKRYKQHQELQADITLAESRRELSRENLQLPLFSVPTSDRAPRHKGPHARTPPDRA